MPWARSSQPAGRPPSARRLRRRQLGPRVLDHQLRPIDEIGVFVFAPDPRRRSGDGAAHGLLQALVARGAAPRPQSHRAPHHVRSARYATRPTLEHQPMTSPLTLGDPALDQDHAHLQELIAQLFDARPEQAASSLDALRAHAARHFAVEDADLLAMQDGNAKCHVDEHAAVLKSLDEVRALLGGETMSAEARSALLRRLAVHLRDWLPEHVQQMDAGVAAHRSKRRFGGAPVQIVRR
ncbi:bacteriohemerythrin [Ramlibacter sp.]|uniref:bacteriohemerythrin n=1 Tax=Ramlibacter sp. TaxID=1917967 RepID=UPI00345E04B3